ncbi:MAG TPA: c-type cytochrome [Gemmatimonadaceae bacterium]|nr:c-type cytochrome [Gemmatimonadaceae bacterium]
MTIVRRRVAEFTTVAMLAILAACRKASGTRTNDALPAPVLPTASGVAALPEGPYAGIAVSALEATATNPYGNDTAAVKRGEQLFLGMNCSGCHGQDAKAGIFAPNLTDDYWRYGGSDADVFNSIYEGRARGMPAWGAALSTNQIWELVAYIRSLGGMTGPRLPRYASQVDTTGANAPTPSNKRQP